jgi:hypothetical protein
MNKLVSLLIITAVIIIPLFAGISYANSNKTWSSIGKGLAIYEGVKVLTGRRGNIVDDVTGGMQSREEYYPQGGSYQGGYDAGYRNGYEEGYNAGFRYGTERERANRQTP